MDYYAGLDVSLEASSVCVVDGTGKIVREAKVASEPEALILFLRSLGCELTRLGLEAGPLSQWLYAALRKRVFRWSFLRRGTSVMLLKRWRLRPIAGTHAV